MLNPFRYNQPNLLDLPRYMMSDPWAVGSQLSSPEAQMPDLRETENAYQVQVACAGIKPDDIQVTIDRGVLRIKGESKGDREGWSYNRRIEKSVQLPETWIDAGGVEACNENGMLHISVPKVKSQHTTPRSIPVKKMEALK